METLGEDLVLLALRPNGTMHAQQRLRFALAGSELLRLTALGRVEISGGRLVVRDPSPTGDTLLDAAFADLCRRGVGRPPQTWIAAARPGLRERYLRRLAADGVVRLETHRALGLFRVSRWRVLDPARVLEIRARLDRIAASSGEPTPDEAAFAGLVHVAGLDAALYPSGSGAKARARLRQIARKRPAENGLPATPDTNWLVSTVIVASLDACAPASVLSDAQSHGTDRHNGHHHGGFDSGGGAAGGRHHGHSAGHEHGGGFSDGHHHP